MIGLPAGIVLGMGLVSGCGGAGSDDSSGAYSVEFRPVLLAGPVEAGSGAEATGSEGSDELTLDFAALDCTEQANETAYLDASPESSVVACGTELGERFALGPAEVDGSMVESVTVTPGVLHDGTTADDYVVAIVLTTDGTAALTDMTQRLRSLDAPRNRLAVLLGQQVLSAPTVMMAITEGEITLAGPFTEDQARDIAAALDVDDG